MRSGRTWTVLLFTCLVLSACGSRDRTSEVGSALREVIAATPVVPVTPAVWTDVREFYTRREFTPVWIDHGKSVKAEAALHVLQAAREHGLEPADYGADDLARRLEADAMKDALNSDAPDVPRQLAELDARVTTALFSLGHDVALGRTRPEVIDRGWKAQRTAPDFVGTLLTAAGADLDKWLDSIRPPHQEYTALQRELGRLREQPGEGDATIDDRIARLRLDLDRWRWMPDDLGARHVLVNIAAFHLTARENGKSVLDMNVVVGKPGTRTPAFSAKMSTVVFSPYWNVPDSIAEGETAPAAARDPSYLDRNQIEILRASKSGAAPVDPSTVNWSDPVELKHLAFRQKPGPKNALGHVKFLFPNQFDVYLHDTPSVRHFARPRRALSHGCVRVEKPEALAAWVLADSPEWDEDRILRAMHGGVEQHVKLKQPIPVHIAYFTTWVDAAGEVHYEPDVYGYDAKQNAALPANTRHLSGRRPPKPSHNNQ